MFKDKLENILNDLGQLEKQSRDSLLSENINARLTETVATYNQGLDKDSKKIEVVNSMRVLKAYRKIQKEKDRAALKKAKKDGEQNA